MDDQPPRGYVPASPTAEEVRPRPGLPGLRPETPRSPPPGDGLTPRRSSALRRLLWLLLIALVVAGIVWWVLNHRQAAPTGRFTSTGPMPVGTQTVAKGDMPIIDNALGTVTPLATVTVQTQINGQLIDVGFQEGQLVNKGDFLAQIDPRPYQVALEQAEGQLAKDQASLANAELDLARYKKLVAQNAIASQTLDTQVATVAQDKGIVQTDQAQVDAQKLNLVYCHIIAPVTGRVGLRQVDPGNYVQTSSSTGIVVVTQLQPISVIFTLPEDSLQAVLKQVHAGQTLQAVALDRTGNTQIEIGQLSTIDNQIDTTTGTVKMRATFPNAALSLFPNQFVNIKLKVDTIQGTAIVPDSAIQRGAPGTFVYLVKPDDTVTAQPVTLGPDDGTKVAVLKGLEPGQQVVTDGADRLKEGAKITITNAATNTGTTTGTTMGTGAAGGQQGGAPATGAAPTGNQPAGDQHEHGLGHGQGGQGRQGQGGQGQPGQGQPGQGQPGQGQPGQGQPGQGQPGAAPSGGQPAGGQTKGSGG